MALFGSKLSVRLVLLFTSGYLFIAFSQAQKYAFQVPIRFTRSEGETEQVALGIKPGQEIGNAVDEFCNNPSHQGFCDGEGVQDKVFETVEKVIKDFGDRHFVNDILEDIFTYRRVLEANSTTDSTYTRELDSNVDPASGRLLYDLVMENENIHKTLEIGMAYGISSLYLAQALKDSMRSEVQHVSIDPFQSTQWGSIGVANLHRSGLSHISRLREDLSYLALPNAVQAKEQYDLIFIDGMHTFDYTLVDFFYADMLLPVGGLLILDDLQMPAVSKVKEYVSKNRAYSYIDQNDERVASRIAIFRKDGHDTKNWDFHVDF